MVYSYFLQCRTRHRYDTLADILSYTEPVHLLHRRYCIDVEESKLKSSTTI